MLKSIHFSFEFFSQPNKFSTGYYGQVANYKLLLVLNIRHRRYYVTVYSIDAHALRFPFTTFSRLHMYMLPIMLVSAKY